MGGRAAQAELRAREAEKRAAEAAASVADRSGEQDSLRDQLEAARAQALRLSSAVQERDDEVQQLQVRPIPWLTWH
jgi:hypothetical protein